MATGKSVRGVSVGSRQVFWLLLLATLLLAPMQVGCSASAGPVLAAELDGQPVTAQALRMAARTLGWPEVLSDRSDLPGGASQVTSGDQVGANSVAVITTLSGSDGPAFLDALQQPGMTRGAFHGWEALIRRRGDPVDPAVSADSSARGFIAWYAGPYGFIAEDATGSGRELEIAEALYAAAQERQLSGWSGSTAIVLAQTEDAPGAASIGDFQALTQQVNEYYRLNSYGRVDFHLLVAGCRWRGWAR